ncbi:MAG: M18 family aminopeptidase, partial [Bacilli bacterium]|nr:M18 family aminopeptidase [Bacilli bacterium]
KGTCSFTVIDEIKKQLKDSHFKELHENEPWHITPGKYFITRNDASLIAFHIGSKNPNNFNIVTTHTDTPALALKPLNENFENGYLKLNIAPYGGLLNYGWLDRPLSIAGKIIVQKENTYQSKIIDLEEPLLVIPSVAIHQNAKANSNLDINSQIDLLPIIHFEEDTDIIRKLIHQKYKIPKSQIDDYDLLLYTKEDSYLIGAKKDILLSPRIDNLTSTFAALKGLLWAHQENNINVFCAFNSEEIGSLTMEGADSNFLLDTLKKIAASLQMDIVTSLSNSFIVSSDNTHAVHPNHPDLSDITNKIYLNKGIVILKEPMSTTTALSSTIFKNICKNAKVPYQNGTNRNDTTSGSTLSGLSLRHVSTTSIDIGLAQLAMHSSVETVGAKDCYYLYKALKQFYHTNIEHHKKGTKLNF